MTTNINDQPHAIVFHSHRTGWTHVVVSDRNTSMDEKHGVYPTRAQADAHLHLWADGSADSITYYVVPAFTVLPGKYPLVNPNDPMTDAQRNRLFAAFNDTFDRLANRHDFTRIILGEPKSWARQHDDLPTLTVGDADRLLEALKFVQDNA